MAKAQPQMGTFATLINKSSSDLKLEGFRNWSGKLTGGVFPQTIVAKSEATFIHAKGTTGSKAAVQYGGLNAAGDSVGVVLAWDAPACFDPPDSPNKVYVIGGPKALIKSMTWDQIHSHLDAASSSGDSYGIKATITHQVPDTAALVANINLIA